MKKNISINISGIIFHIEEDGYEKLKEYLESINKYFSTFDGSSEIIADIESRIAEIFLSKLNEGKQVINIEDVTTLITTMGGIQDFQAVEEEVSLETIEETGEQHSYEESQSTASSGSTQEAPKKLYRDKNRQLIGGVASGIAHYLGIDPLWIRLIFIIMLFDVFLTFAISGFVIITYIVLWIVVPESDSLQEDKKLKKIYRNPQGRVVGGVANGIATYFDIDVAMVRVLFVLAIVFGGVGILTYIVLWLILPEAKSITDKVQMKGKEVTLENIESNIKSTQEAKANPKEESVIVKVLLFPFRIIAIILSGIGRALGPIAKFIIDFIRVILGAVLTILGLSILFSVLIAGSVYLGLMAGGELVHIDIFPLELMHDTFSTLGFVAAMVVVGIPALAIMFVGLSIASKTRIPSATVGWSMFGIWLIGIVGIAFTLPSIIRDLRVEGEHTRTSYYEVDADQMVLDISGIGYEDYEGARLKLRGYDGSEIKLVQEFSARGATLREAVEHARMIEYNVTQDDSILVFDSNINFSSESRFRDQDLLMTLYIPYGQNFVMKNNFDDLIYYSFGYQGFSSSQIVGNTWMFNPTGLECLSCTNYTSSSEKRREDYESLYEENLKTNKNDTAFDMSNFNELTISGPYKVNIVQGEEYRVILTGTERYVANSTVEQSGNNLSISYNEDNDRDIHRYNRRVSVKIMCPRLSDIRFHGAVIGDVSGFEEDDLYIRLDGASELELDADVYSLEIRLSGAAQLDVTGVGNEVKANISTASYLNTYNFRAEGVDLKASGASKARVYASETLKINASLVSEVKYRGGADVTTVKSSSFSNVKED